MFLPDKLIYFPIESILYSIPYLILGIVSLWGIMKWNYCIGVINSNKRIYNTIFFVFLLFFGLRWHIMTDTIAYNKWFEIIEPSWGFMSDSPIFIEPGFLLMLIGTKALNLGFSSFVFINSLVDLCLLYVCVKKYAINIPLTLLLFLAFNGIAFEINLMRNMKALLIFLYSIQFIQKRNFIKYAICQAIAISFHVSAIIFIPLYWLCNIKYNGILLLVCSIFSVSVYLFFPNMLEGLILSVISVSPEDLEKVSRYASQGNESRLNLGTIERLLTLLFVLLSYNKIKEELFTVFANLYICFFVSYSFLGFNSIFRDRLPYLFIFSYWFLYPYILQFYQKKMPYFKSILILFCFMKIVQATSYCAAYYENILFETTTISEREYLNDKIGER